MSYSTPAAFPSESSIYQNYKQKFEKISHKEDQSAKQKVLKSRIYQIVISLFKDCDLNYSTHMTAEHMSKGKLAGNYAVNALARTEELLNKMIPPVSSAKKKLIEDAYEIQASTSPVKKAQKKIQQLEVRESLAIPLSFQNHAVMMVITCNGEEKGKKMYTIELHNTGLGIDEYHYKKVDKNGRELYQTAFKIINIPEENLLGKKAIFLDKLLDRGDITDKLIPIVYDKVGNSSSIKTLYEKIIPLAGGEIEHPSSDPVDWRPCQLGGSCSLSCIRSVLGTHFSPEENRRFEETARYELLLKTYKQIISGSGNSTTNKIVALEMVNEILYRHSNIGLHSPELVMIKQKLEAMTPNKAIVKSEPQFEVNIYNDLSLAFETFKKGNSSEESIQKTTSLLLKAQQSLNDLSQMPNSVSKEDLKKIEAFTDQIMNFRKDRPLNQQEIYLLAALSSLTRYAVGNLYNSVNKDEKNTKSTEQLYKLYHKLNPTYFSINREVNVLQLDSKFSSSPLHGIIQKAQRDIYGQQRDTTPAGMEKIRENMGSPSLQAFLANVSPDVNKSENI
jgi:hypothetical protein